MGGLLSGLWSQLFGVSEFKMCIVGLDNAGKTTILYKLHLGDVVATHPTIGSNVEQVTRNNIKITVWDIGKITIYLFLVFLNVEKRWTGTIEVDVVDVLYGFKGANYGD
jgi:hypothetical protein